MTTNSSSVLRRKRFICSPLHPARFGSLILQPNQLFRLGRVGRHGEPGVASGLPVLILEHGVPTVDPLRDTPPVPRDVVIPPRLLIILEKDPGIGAVVLRQAGEPEMPLSHPYGDR